MSQPAGRPTVSISRAALIWAIVGVVVIALVAALIGGWIGSSATAADSAASEPTATPTPEASPTVVLDEEQLAELEARVAEILPAGSAIRVGTGAPAEDRGMVGDVYINLTNSDVYVRRDSGWEVVGNLRVDMAENLTGPAGAPGTPGAPGSPGDTGPRGEAGQDGTQVVLGVGAPEAETTCAPDGSVYIDTETSTYYTCTAGAWVLFGPEDTDAEAETEG